MTVLDLDAFERTPVADKPFPYVVVPHFVTGEAFERALADYPKIGKPGSFPVFTQKPGPGLRAVLDALEGDDFREAVERKFGIDLSGKPTMTTLRSRARARDGQIHLDSKTKVVTVLVYLNRASDAFESHAGCLRILNGPDNLQNFAAEVPPVNGTLLVFPCVPNAWHGHESFEGERQVIQLNWVTGEDVVRREQRRHAVSAFFKSLNPF
ncbi:MAG: 2OG-Fe(II) oxygenase [Alphaproteobacteria bacterium]|nr:2OG-Fe(II) oxygenase [Alphaproteobacteria bacterium]